MSTITHAHKTLADTLWSNDSSLLRHVTLAVVGSIALWISAKIQVPFYPVPMTMQTFVVLVIGMAFGWRLGAATLALYIAEGAMGAIIGWDKPVLQFGLYPFLPGAAFKIALAALLMPAIWKFASPKGK